MQLREQSARDLATSGGRHDRDDRSDPVVDLAERSTRSRAGLVAFLAGLVLAASVVLLVVQNTGTVAMEWLSFDLEWPLWTFIGLSFVAGLVTAPLLLAAFRHARKRRATRRELLAEARRAGR
jgi:uncharacterized integral membrane protein